MTLSKLNQTLLACAIGAAISLFSVGIAHRTMSSEESTEWSTKSDSPDGSLIARVGSEIVDSGPPAPPQTVTVRLEQTEAPHRHEDVLVLSQDPSEDPQVALSWDIPAHLHVSYGHDTLVLSKLPRAFGQEIKFDDHYSSKKSR